MITKIPVSKIAFLSSLLAVLAISLTLTGCKEVRYSYVVLRDVPKKPAFTVIDRYRYSDNRLVGEVELSLIKLGLSVVSPPTQKTVKTKRGGIDAKEGQITAGSKQATKGRVNTDEVTEVYDILGETNADYVISVDSKLDVFKIIKKNSLEILAVKEADIFSMRTGPMSAEPDKSKALKEYALYDYFKALGFKVRKPAVERPKKEKPKKNKYKDQEDF